MKNWSEYNIAIISSLGCGYIFHDFPSSFRRLYYAFRFWFFLWRSVLFSLSSCCSRLKKRKPVEKTEMELHLKWNMDFHIIEHFSMLSVVFTIFSIVCKHFEWHQWNHAIASVYSKNASQILRNCRKYAESAKERISNNQKKKNRCKNIKLWKKKAKNKKKEDEEEEWIQNTHYAMEQHRQKEGMNAFYFRSDEKFNFWDPSVASVRCNTPQHQTSHAENCLNAFTIRLPSCLQQRKTVAGRVVYFLARIDCIFIFAVSNLSVPLFLKAFHKNYARMNFRFSSLQLLCKVVRINYCISCIWKKQKTNKQNRPNQMKSKRTHEPLSWSGQIENEVRKFIDGPL